MDAFDVAAECLCSVGEMNGAKWRRWKGCRSPMYRRDWIESNYTSIWTALFFLSYNERKKIKSDDFHRLKIWSAGLSAIIELRLNSTSSTEQFEHRLPVTITIYCRSDFSITNPCEPQNDRVNLLYIGFRARIHRQRQRQFISQPIKFSPLHSNIDEKQKTFPMCPSFSVFTSTRSIHS